MGDDLDPDGGRRDQFHDEEHEVHEGAVIPNEREESTTIHEIDACERKGQLVRPFFKHYIDQS
jgi:hypothetical protein